VPRSRTSGTERREVRSSWCGVMSSVRKRSGGGLPDHSGTAGSGDQFLSVSRQARLYEVGQAGVVPFYQISIT